MYSQIYQAMRLVWPGGLETRRHLHDLKRTQWLSRSELEALQLRRIQQLVRDAYENVPFYRERYQREGIHPENIKSLEDFQILPFLTGEEVSNHLDRLVSTGFRGKLHPSESGGSTGRSIQFFVGDSFWWWNVALELRRRGWYGVQEGDKVAWFWGAARDMPGWSATERMKAHIMR